MIPLVPTIGKTTRNYQGLWGPAPSDPTAMLAEMSEILQNLDRCYGSCLHPLSRSVLVPRWVNATRLRQKWHKLPGCLDLKTLYTPLNKIRNCQAWIWFWVFHLIKVLYLILANPPGKWISVHCPLVVSAAMTELLSVWRNWQMLWETKIEKFYLKMGSVIVDISRASLQLCAWI